MTIPSVNKKRVSSEEKEKEIISKYKKKENWYGYPKIYWLGGGLVVTLLLCFYLATKVYGNNKPPQSNNQQQQPEIPQLDREYPPMPSGGEPYSQQTHQQQSQAPNQTQIPISSNAERMLKRDVLNRIPVSDNHLMQFESRYTQTPNARLQPQPAPQPQPQPQQQKKQEELGTGEGQFEAETRTKEYYPNNKEGGGEGTPLPPVNYEELRQQYDDAF